MNPIIEYIHKLIETPTKDREEKLPRGLDVRGLDSVKKVNKPWGFELWLSDATDTPYALKILYIKKGTKTSLQLHNEKSEHNFVLAGTINLHYKNLEAQNIEQATLGAGQVIKILPQTVHRIEAATDVILVEASSHHLDDVTRLEDDYERPHGKIDSEHSR